jgi:hypothetical protein
VSLDVVEMWSLRRTFQFSCRAAILAAASFCAIPAIAQEDQRPPQQEAPKRPQPYGGGSPLDVLMSTRLWTDVPEAKDFVKATRPPEDRLDYQPTTGADPVRPKPRTQAELKDLQDELERAGAYNERAAGIGKRNFHAEAQKTKPSHTAAKTN